MTLDTWLRIIATGLPLLGVLAVWLSKNRLGHVQRWLATVTLGIAGLVALALFLLNRQYACVLLSGSHNCLAKGFSTSSIFLLNAVQAIRSLFLRGKNKTFDHILILLLSSAWAGMGLAVNLLELLIFLNLFFYVIYKWLDRKGLGWGFFVVRSDYPDDQRHYDNDSK
jgi:hypothetical protein